MAAETHADLRRTAPPGRDVGPNDDVDRALLAFDGSPIVYFNFNNVLRDPPSRVTTPVMLVEAAPIVAATPPAPVEAVAEPPAQDEALPIEAVPDHEAEASEADLPIPEPVAAEPAVIETVTAEPVVIEAVAAEPMMIEAVAAEPVMVEAVAAEPVMIEAVATEPVMIEAVAAEPVMIEAVAAEAPSPAAPEATGIHLNLAYRLSRLAMPGLGLPELGAEALAARAASPAPVTPPVQAGHLLPAFGQMAASASADQPTNAEPGEPEPQPAAETSPEMPAMGDMFRLVSGRQALETRARDALGVSRFSLGQSHPARPAPPRPLAAGSDMPAAATTPAPRPKETAAAAPDPAVPAVDLFRRL